MFSEGEYPNVCVYLYLYRLLILSRNNYLLNEWQLSSGNFSFPSSYCDYFLVLFIEAFRYLISFSLHRLIYTFYHYIL